VCTGAGVAGTSVLVAAAVLVLIGVCVLSRTVGTDVFVGVFVKVAVGSATATAIVANSPRTPMASPTISIPAANKTGPTSVNLPGNTASPPVVQAVALWHSLSISPMVNHLLICVNS
jgi:hypothetical protein